MTREEAIQVLTDIKRIRSDEIAKAIDMAIEALSAEPKLIRVEYSPFRIKETSTSSQTSFRGTQEVHYYEVPSVVRCKDCQYRKKIGTLYYCDLDEYNVKDTDFCSWGERREE